MFSVCKTIVILYKMHFLLIFLGVWNGLIELNYFLWKILLQFLSDVSKRINHENRGSTVYDFAVAEEARKWV